MTIKKAVNDDNKKAAHDDNKKAAHDDNKKAAHDHVTRYRDVLLERQLLNSLS